MPEPVLTHLQQALQDTHPVTVGSLNKVYRYLISRINNASEGGSAFYKIFGNKATFSDLITFSGDPDYGVKEGTIFNVVGPDPNGFSGANYVCIKQYKINGSTYQTKTFVEASSYNPSETYYIEIDGEYVIIPTQSQESWDSKGSTKWYRSEFSNYKHGSTLVTTSNITNYWSDFWDGFGGTQPQLIAGDAISIVESANKVQNTFSVKYDNKTVKRHTPVLVESGHTFNKVANYYFTFDTTTSTYEKIQNPTQNQFDTRTENWYYSSQAEYDKLYVPSANGTSTLGVVKQGTNVTISNGVISVATAKSTSNLGLVKKGDNISIDDNGTISVPLANGTSTLGVVKQGTNVTISNGVISVATGSTNLGLAKSGDATELNNGSVNVKVDDTTIKINGNNNLYVVTADSNAPGIVQPGSNINISSGVISVDSLDLGGSTEEGCLIKVENKYNSESETHYPAVHIIGKRTDSGSTEPNADSALYVDGDIKCEGYISGTKVFHAVWNDVSDAIEVQDDLEVEPGCCYMFDGTRYKKTEEYCQKGIIGIHSDTAGSMLGRKGRHKELDISIGGFVLAYVDGTYECGTPLTCGPDGCLTEMKREDVREYPERLVATYWKPEPEDYWGPEGSQIAVNDRQWVKIK